MERVHQIEQELVKKLKSIYRKYKMYRYNIKVSKEGDRDIQDTVRSVHTYMWSLDDQSRKELVNEICHPNNETDRQEILCALNKGASFSYKINKPNNK